MTLRDAGYDGPLVILDPCSEMPSDRPPLSKQVLSGEWEPHQATTRSSTRLAEMDVDLELGVAATSLEASTRTLTTSDGRTLGASGVVVATGATPRRLPQQPHGVHALRTMDDCLELRSELARRPARVVVIGAGFIGAEVAATCRGLGLAVTLVEAGQVPLGRVLPGRIGSFIADLHRGHGVDVRLGVGVSELIADGDGRVSAVQLEDGSTVDSDVVVVGIGVVPVVDWLDRSGLEVGNGIVCDESLLAAPGIVAAGDVVSWPNQRFGQVMRVEQWENAVEQGEHAARRLLAELGMGEHPGPFAPLPWFWSDQYDRKLQMAGWPSGDDELQIVEGSVEEQRFVGLFRRGDQVSAVLGVNRPRHVMKARMAMSDSLDWAPVRALFP